MEKLPKHLYCQIEEQLRSMIGQMINQRNITNLKYQIRDLLTGYEQKYQAEYLVPEIHAYQNKFDRTKLHLVDHDNAEHFRQASEWIEL